MIIPKGVPAMSISISACWDAVNMCTETSAEMRNIKEADPGLKMMSMLWVIYIPDISTHMQSHFEQMHAQTQMRSVESLTIQEGLWVYHCRSLAAPFFSSEWRQHVSLSGSRWCNHLFISLHLSSFSSSPPSALFTCLCLLVSLFVSLFFLLYVSFLAACSLPPLCVCMWVRASFLDLLKDLCYVEILPASPCKCHQIRTGFELVMCEHLFLKRLQNQCIHLHSSNIQYLYPIDA